MTIQSRDDLKSVEGRLRPAHTALLVIDMQNDFCAEGSYIEKVVGKDAGPCRVVAKPIMALVEQARAAGVPVVWVITNYTRETLLPGIAVKFGERGEALCCVPGTWGHEYFGVTPAKGEPVVGKQCFSGFAATDLDKILRSRGVRTVVLAGVQTNVCVDSTMRDAHSHGYCVAVAKDCVASHTPEAHEATLKNIQFVFGDVIESSRIGAIWRGER